jgi:hypothetical protein
MRDSEVRKMKASMQVLIDINAADVFDCAAFRKLIDSIESHVWIIQREGNDVKSSTNA